MEFPHFLESSNVRVLWHKKDKYLNYDDDEMGDGKKEDDKDAFVLDLTKPGIGDFMIGGQIYGAKMDLIFLTNLLEARKQLGSSNFIFKSYFKSTNFTQFEFKI